jgi:hypothetical protein
MIGSLLLICLSWTIGCGPSAAPEEENFIVVYTSQDQVYAEKIFKRFTAEYRH